MEFLEKDLEYKKYEGLVNALDSYEKVKLYLFYRIIDIALLFETGSQFNYHSLEDFFKINVFDAGEEWEIQGWAKRFKIHCPAHEFMIRMEENNITKPLINKINLKE